MDKWDMVYPNTEKGAINCLKSMFREGINFKGSSAIPDPDPAVNGVWKVTIPSLPENDGRTNIVYMKGHKNVWGQIRQNNDFEEVF